MAFTECHILDTGYCLTPESALFQRGSWKWGRCHCLVALLHHPTEGWGLWDTGYAPRMWTETQRFPYRIYRFGTPLPRQPDRSILSQLPGLGIAAGDVRWIVLSHLHGDHAAGIHDFPGARLIAARSAYDYATSLRGLAAVRKGYVPALFPGDFADRAEFIDQFTGDALEGMGCSVDLFGDGAARLFPLRGHARGQIGMLAETTRGAFLFPADACLHRISVRDGRLPGIITNIIADEPAQIAPTVQRLAAFARARPHVAVVPTHCPEAYWEYVGKVGTSGGFGKFGS